MEDDEERPGTQKEIELTMADDYIVYTNAKVNQNFLREN